MRRQDNSSVLHNDQNMVILLGIGIFVGGVFMVITSPIWLPIAGIAHLANKGIKHIRNKTSKSDESEVTQVNDSSEQNPALTDIENDKTNPAILHRFQTSDMGPAEAVEPRDQNNVRYSPRRI